MRGALFVLTLSLGLGCGNDKAPDAAGPVPEAKPVGSMGAAPARPGDATPPDNASVAEPTKTAAAAQPEYREITVPAGTILPLELRSSVGSDTSSVEDPVRATLRRPITIRGTQALPAGTVVTGHVTQAVRSARVKGRGRVAFRFNRIDPPGGGPLPIRTGTIARVAPATKKRDAAKIGAGAAGGAIVGGILGGGDGAAKGAVVGGGAGTAVVLSTRGREIRLGPGAPLSVRLAAPLTLRVPLR